MTMTAGGGTVIHPRKQRSLPQLGSGEVRTFLWPGRGPRCCLCSVITLGVLVFRETVRVHGRTARPS